MTKEPAASERYFSRASEHQIQLGLDHGVHSGRRSEFGKQQKPRRRRSATASRGGRCGAGQLGCLLVRESAVFGALDFLPTAVRLLEIKDFPGLFRVVEDVRSGRELQVKVRRVYRFIDGSLSHDARSGFIQLRLAVHLRTPSVDNQICLRMGCVG
jgi:hypothetical protein